MADRERGDDDDGRSRICKICDRYFSCGRALGGHMRSHLTTLKLPNQNNVTAATNKRTKRRRRDPKRRIRWRRSSSSDSQSLEHEDVDDQSSEELAILREDTGIIIKEEIEENSLYSLRSNLRKSRRLSDPQFSFSTTNSVAVNDSHSDTEEFTGRRWHHPIEDVAVEPEPVSSISDGSPEEDVAISLMLLSRAELRPIVLSKGDDDQLEHKQRRRKFECEACRKVFPTYQALGGHRAGLKRGGGCCIPIPMPPAGDVEVSREKKIHECPYCFRIFTSGQALGGHKRSHMVAGGGRDLDGELEEGMLDLNLPAPVDEASSVVSNAEFVDLKKLQ